MELCDKSNNCTKFQFYTEQVRVVNSFCDFTSLCPHCDMTSHLIWINQNLEIILATKSAITKKEKHSSSF